MDPTGEKTAATLLAAYVPVNYAAGRAAGVVGWGS
jgi:hypothetical protein